MPSTERNQRPGALLWLIALASLVLPIVGVGLALYGIFKSAGGAAIGWAWLAAGVLVLIADLVIDQRWAYWLKSSEPALNRRGEQLVGEIVTVVEAIPPGGRGVVRSGDSVWAAEGTEAETDAKVRVAGCKGTVLQVVAV